MRPSDIHYTQDSISDKFKKRPNDISPVPLEVTFKELLHELLKECDIETIEVVYDEGAWWVIRGNRRLFLYQWLERVNILTEVDVIVRDLNDPKVEAEYREKKDTTSGGRSIRCRRGKLPGRLTEIYNKYKEENKIFGTLMREFLVESVESDDYMELY